MCRIYLSIPVVIRDRDNVIDTMISDLAGLSKFSKAPFIFDHWKPGWIYDKQSVSKADIFIFTHPTNAFKFSKATLPSSVLREYEQALALGKQILLAYKNTVGEINFYCVTAQSGAIISGIAGTTNSLAVRLEQEIFLKATSRVKESERCGKTDTYNPCAEIPLDCNLGLFEPTKMKTIGLCSTAESTTYDRRLLL